MCGIRLQGLLFHLCNPILRFRLFAAKSWLRFLVNEDRNGAHKLCMRKFYDNGETCTFEIWPVNQKCDVDIIIG